MKVIVAERFVEAWNRITLDIIDSTWCTYQTKWGQDREKEETETKDDGHQQVIYRSTT
jgi:hypothetical protein